MLAKFGERTQDKLNWLREQIEMRSIGLGWTELKGQWFSSSDENTGTARSSEDDSRRRGGAAREWSAAFEDR